MLANCLIRRLMTRSFRTQATAPIRRPRGNALGRLIEELESRALPATFTAVGTQLNLVLNTADESVDIVSTGPTYTLTLTGDTWVGTNSSTVSGNGSVTLTITAGAFNTGIDIQDAAAGVAVTFVNSGSHTYIDSVDVTLQNSAAGAITFNGITSFAGSASLTANTTANIVVDAPVSTVNGNLTLSGDEPISGNSAGVDITAAVQATGTGSVSISSTATVTSSEGAIGDGVAVSGRGTITSGSGMVTVTGSEDSGEGGIGDGVQVSGGGTITSGSGTVTVTGSEDCVGGGIGAGVEVNGGTITSGGGAVIVTGSAEGGIVNGVEVSDGGTITSGGGAVIVTGSAADGIVAGVEVSGGGTITSGGGAVAVMGSVATGPDDISDGVEVSNGGAITTAGTNAPITVTTNALVLASPGSQEISGSIDSGTGTTTILTVTPSTQIDLGGPNSSNGSPFTLGLTAAELARITAGTLVVGNTSTGPVTVSAPITFLTATNLIINTASGNNIAFSGPSYILSAGGNVTLSTSGTGAITADSALTDILAGAGTISLAAGSGGIGASGSPLVVSGTNLDPPPPATATSICKRRARSRSTRPACPLAPGRSSSMAVPSHSGATTAPARVLNSPSMLGRWRSAHPAKR